jgi:hypothetical protein
MKRLFTTQSLLAALAATACSSSSPPADPVTVGPAGGAADAGGAPTIADASPSADAPAPTLDATAALGPFDAAACAPNPPTGDYPLDVATVVHTKCTTCHQSPPKNHAPFSLLTYEDAIQTLFPGVLRWQEMAYVIQPGASPHMPFGNAPQLTPAEKQTLDDWFAGCARPVPAAAGNGVDASPDDASTD